MKGPTGDFTEEKLRDERVFDDLRLLLGFQQLAASSNWLFDFYGGLGLRSRDMTIVDEQLDLTNNQYSYTVEDQDDTVISVFLGVKVGLGFSLPLSMSTSALSVQPSAKDLVLVGPAARRRHRCRVPGCGGCGR